MELKPSYKIVDYREKMHFAMGLFLISPVVSVLFYSIFLFSWLTSGEGSVIREDMRNGTNIFYIALSASFIVVYGLNLVITFLKYIRHKKEYDYN